MNALETGLFTLLTGDSDLTTELGGEYIYNQTAPQGQARPYLVFSKAGGGDRNWSPSRWKNYVYLVKAVADGLKKAGTVMEKIDAALHNQVITVTGYTNMVTFMEQEVDYVETLDNGKAVFHEGAMFRIRLDN